MSKAFEAFCKTVTNCKTLQCVFRKVVMQHFLAVEYQGICWSLGTMVPPWGLKAGTLLIVSLGKPPAIFKTASSAYWFLCRGRIEDCFCVVSLSQACRQSTLHWFIMYLCISEEIPSKTNVV